MSWLDARAQVANGELSNEMAKLGYRHSTLHRLAQQPGHTLESVLGLQTNDSGLALLDLQIDEQTGKLLPFEVPAFSALASSSSVISHFRVRLQSRELSK